MNRRVFLKSNAAALALPVLGALGAPAPSTSRQLLFGTDYYPDQTDESLWQEDARMMSGMGVTNVRIAEFAWALMEPSEGRFNLDWLHRAVDLLHGHNIDVILGTPSAAPPPWLTQKYPEVLEVDDKGLTLSTEGRRFTCPTNKTYRRLALSIAAEMANSFANTPGVIGWQIDNELTLGSSPRCYCKFCRAGFQQWLHSQYGTLDALNKAWGTVFWSQVYSDFSQIPVPLPSGAPPNPGMALDYDRYQSYANVSFLKEQLAMLRKTCPRHFLTTNNVGLVDTINQRGLYANLDFAANDNYPGFFSTQASVPVEQVAPVVSLSHDIMRSARNGKPFLIMEEQVGKAGQPTFCPQPQKGQLRLWSYQAVAHGAMGINYFRWDTATFGAEEYWHGLLNHDRSKSPGYDEIKQTIQELKALGYDALNAPYLANAGLCFDYDSDWALTIQPGQPKLKYLSEITSWYGPLWAGNIGMDLVDAAHDLSRYKVLFAPLMYVVSEKQANTIRNFVRNGGVFVTSFRLGVKNSSSQIVKTPLPGLLRDVMGVTVEDYVPMYSEKQGVKFSPALAGPDAECQLWYDVLKPSTAEVMASYTMGGHAGAVAITSNSFGKGKAIYIGAKLDESSLRRVLHAIAAMTDVRAEIEAPHGIEIAARQTDRDKWIFILNHTSRPQTVTTREGSIKLDAYGVHVLRTS
jgi:beta-galactosidase